MAPAHSSLASVDARSFILNKLLSPPSSASQAKKAFDHLSGCLVTDSYGAVQNVRFARDAYNSRPGMLQEFVT